MDASDLVSILIQGNVWSGKNIRRSRFPYLLIKPDGVANLVSNIHSSFEGDPGRHRDSRDLPRVSSPKSHPTQYTLLTIFTDKSETGLTRRGCVMAIRPVLHRLLSNRY